MSQDFANKNSKPGELIHEVLDSDRQKQYSQHQTPIARTIEVKHITSNYAIAYGCVVVNEIRTYIEREPPRS